GAADLAAESAALRTDIAGPLDARKGLDDGAAIEHDGTAARVDHDHRLDGGAVGEEQSLRWTNDVHVFRASRPGSLLEPCRVRAQGGTVVLDEVPREVDQRAARSARGQLVPPAFELIVDRVGTNFRLEAGGQ